MAITVRRAPVVSNIPSNPKFEFLNITSFKGLDISENPLAMDYSSASDMLNLYVDINGVLTTRPRTEKFLSIREQDKKEILYIYKLDKGLLIHGIDNEDKNALWVYRDSTKSYKKVTGAVESLVETKLGVFEKDDKTFILSGDEYLYIKEIDSDYVLKDVYNDEDTYIPTTHIGYIYPKNSVFQLNEGDVVQSDDIVLKPHEPANILSSKYYHKYFWDDNVDYSSLEGEFYIDEYESIEVDTGLTAVNVTTKYSQYLPDDKILMYAHEEGYSSYIKIIDNKNNMDVVNYWQYPSNEKILAISRNGKYKLSLHGTELRRYDEANNHIVINTSMLPTTYANSGGRVNYGCFISDDGNRLLFKTRKGIEFEFEPGLLFYDIDNDIEHNHELQRSEFYTNESFDEIIYVESTDGGTAIEKFSKINTAVPENDFNLLLIHAGNSLLYNKATTKKLDKIILYCDSNSIYMYDIGNTSEYDNDYKIIYGEEINTTAHDTVRIFINNDESKVNVIGINDYDTSNKVTTYLSSMKSFSRSISLFKDYVVNDIKGDGYGTFLSDWSMSKLLYLASKAKHSGKNIIGKVFFNKDKPVLTVLKTNDTHEKSYNLENYIRFKNNYWFYGNSNRIYYTNNNDPTYIPEYNYNDFGTNSRLTGLNLASYDVLVAYKSDKIYIIYENENGTLIFQESKSDNGNVSVNAPIITPLNERIVHVGRDGIYSLEQMANIQSTDRNAVNISLNIHPLLKNENLENVITLSYKYWTYFIIPEKFYSKIYVLDDRNGEWFYWEINKRITNIWVKTVEGDDYIFFSSDDFSVYSLQTDDIKFEIDDLPEDFSGDYELYEYYDHDREIIRWNWTSQILSMKTVNYLKQLVNTSFIVADNDNKDSYGLNYKFKVFRKLASETADFTIEDRLDYVANVTKKTHISRFNFLQIELNNISDSLDHNKLKLIGLAFKYRFLEGSV